MKKADLIIIAIVLISALTFLGIREYSKYTTAKNSSGLYAEIQIDGQVFKTIELTEETDETILLETELGQNTIVIHDGIVHMQDADCRDQICVNEKPMSEVGDIIVCLPHKVVVEIKGSEKSSIDGVSN